MDDLIEQEYQPCRSRRTYINKGYLARIINIISDHVINNTEISDISDLDNFNKFITRIKIEYHYQSKYVKKFLKPRIIKINTKYFLKIMTLNRRIFNNYYGNKGENEPYKFPKSIEDKKKFIDDHFTVLHHDDITILTDSIFKLVLIQELTNFTCNEYLYKHIMNIKKYKF